MLGQTQDALLKKTEQAVQAKVPANRQYAFHRIVTAGLKVMYEQETHALMVKQLVANGDPSELAGEGAAKLLGMLFKKSRGTMPMNAAIPATIVLMCEGLDFMQKAGKFQSTPDTVAQAMKSLSSNLLQLFGVTPDKLQGMINQHAGQQPQPQVTPQPTPAPGGILSSAAGA
jgi:hypothetical protein